MDLQFTEEQEMLREAVRGMCADYSNTEQVRELEDTPEGYSTELWAQLAGMDLLGLTLPPEFGGSGMGAVDTVVIYEELGRAIANTPHLVSNLLGGELLVRGGSDAQKQAWLPAMAKGEKILTLAWHEPFRGDTPEGIQLEAKQDGDDFLLSGTKVVVPFASVADGIVTIARTGPGEQDIDLFLVQAGAEGLSMEQTFTVASDAAYELTFDGVRVSEADRLGEAGAGWELFLAAMSLPLIAAAAMANGGTARTQELTVDYAKERVQFGVPIGSFQGVAHPIADIATEQLGSETLTLQAAWAYDTGRGRDVQVLAAMAKQFAAETFRRATRVAHQTFGGVGFTLAIDVQLYFRRAKYLQLTWFEPKVLAEKVAAAELDGDDAFVGMTV